MKEGVYNGFDGYLYLDVGVYKVGGVGRRWIGADKARYVAIRSWYEADRARYEAERKVRVIEGGL